MKLSLLFPAILLCLPAVSQPVLVQDILPGIFSSHPIRLTEFNNELHFFANDGVAGMELWSYNGSKVKLEQDIYAGSMDCTPITNNKRIAVLNGRMYFPADDGNTGLELFSYDGVTPPVLVSDINGGMNGSDIAEVVALTGKLYFGANNSANGKELWEYDPSTGQAAQVSFIHTAALGSSPENLTVMNGKLYFSAFTPATGVELYEYNPANGQVQLLSDINPLNLSSDPACLTAVFGKLYFTAVNADYGRELYIYDGTSVQRLTDLNPGPADGLSQEIQEQATIGAAGNFIYFAGDDGNSGFQLHKFDIVNGTASQVAVINPTGSSIPAGFVYYANKIFFTADDGTHGRELWVLDGSNPPVMVADINSNSAVNFNPSELYIYNNSLYFTAYGDMGVELYQLTDPKAGITTPPAMPLVSVYPNPTTGVVHIELSLPHSESLHVRLVDATGRTVLTSKMKVSYEGDARIAIPMTHMPTGIYYYYIGNASGKTIVAGRVAKM